MAPASRPSLPDHRSLRIRLCAGSEQLNRSIRCGCCLFCRPLEILIISFATLVGANQQASPRRAARDDGPMGAQAIALKEACGGFVIPERSITTSGLHPGVVRIG